VTEQTPTPAPTPAPEAVAPAPPQGLEKYWDAQGAKLNTDALAKDYGELSSFKKAQDDLRATLPKTPDDYKFEFKAPQDFKVPDGVQFKVDPKDPRIPLVREVAAKHALPQSVIDDLVVADAKLKIAEHQQNLEIVAAERAKLGEKGQARMDAVKSFLGDDFEHLSLALDSADAFQALERLIARASSSSIPGAGGGGHEPPKPPQQITDRWYPSQKVG
jgi:hypothetical protein